MKPYLLALALFSLPAAIAAQNQHPTHIYAITGTLHNATSGEPIPEAHLSATRNDFKPCPQTDSRSDYRSIEADATPQGTFSITLPCPGTWRLSASAPGYSEQNYQQHDTFYTGIVLDSAHPSFDAHFDLIPPASITGRILDEAGEPVRSARVMLLNADLADAQLQPRPNASNISDDRGFYEFANILPGNYLISVLAQPWYARESAAQTHNNPTDPSLDLTYPLTYFPSATDATSATVLHVAAGQQQEADVHLVPVPAIHLVIPPPDPQPAPQPRGQPGNRANNFAPQIPQLALITPFGPEHINPTSISNKPDGSIEITGFPPGDYKILPNTFGRGQSNQQSEARTLTLNDDSGRTATLSAAKPTPPTETPNLKLTGTTTLNREPTAGALVLLVAATPPDSTGHFKIFREQSNTDGSFTFYRIPAGNYILLAIQNGWSLPWTDPATLSTYLIHGTPLQLNTSKTLPTPIPAQ